jgi:hypothetical protein
MLEPLCLFNYGFFFIVEVELVDSLVNISKLVSSFDLSVV